MAARETEEDTMTADTTPVHTPSEEAARAIEEARAVLAEAAADIASDDADRLAHGFELAAGCADHIARALWYLRRAEREKAATPS
jgi:hypothetical protein